MGGQSYSAYFWRFWTHGDRKRMSYAKQNTMVGRKRSICGASAPLLMRLAGRGHSRFLRCELVRSSSHAKRDARKTRPSVQETGKRFACLIASIPYRPYRVHVLESLAHGLLSAGNGRVKVGELIESGLFRSAAQRWFDDKGITTEPSRDKFPSPRGV